MVPEAEEQEVTLDAGMPVGNEDGEDLGTLASVLVDEDTEEAGFVVVKFANVERLVPFEAVTDVDGGKLILDMDAETLAELPETKSDREPTDAEMEKAYSVLGLYEEEGDEEEES